MKRRSSICRLSRPEQPIYRVIKFCLRSRNGGPCGIRTHDLRIKSPMLSPARTGYERSRVGLPRQPALVGKWIQ